MATGNFLKSVPKPLEAHTCEEEERNDGRKVWGRICRWQRKTLAPALSIKDLEGEHFCFHSSIGEEPGLRVGRT